MSAICASFLSSTRCSSRPRRRWSRTRAAIARWKQLAAGEIASVTRIAKLGLEIFAVRVPRSGDTGYGSGDISGLWRAF